MPTRAATASRRPRPPRAVLVRRWSAVLVLALVAYLYWSPLTSYLETRRTVALRAAEVEALTTERVALERRLRAQTSDQALAREARRLGYVQPGEQLFIVKGIPEWRRAEAARARAPGRAGGG